MYFLNLCQQTCTTPFQVATRQGIGRVCRELGSFSSNPGLLFTVRCAIIEPPRLPILLFSYLPLLRISSSPPLLLILLFYLATSFPNPPLLLSYLFSLSTSFPYPPLPPSHLFSLSTSPPWPSLS
jgi:hypothetical protein